MRRLRRIPMPGGAQPSEMPPTPAPKPTTPAAAVPVIRKGIYLSALVYVEGDMPAPADFIGPAVAALEAALGKTSQGHHDLTITLKHVEVQNNVEQSASESEEKDVGFQF